MKIKLDGYFLKVWLDQSKLDQIPESWKHPTKTDAKYLLLANEAERTLIDSFIVEEGLLPEDLCYDWILVYQEDDDKISKDKILKAIQRMEEYPCCMSCYLNYEEVVAARAMRDNMIRILKEEVGL